jgi:hypothetical protein
MAIDYNPAGRPRRDSQMQDLARLHGTASTQKSMERQPNYFSDSKTPDPDGERDTASLERSGVGEKSNRGINDPTGSRTNRG